MQRRNVECLTEAEKWCHRSGRLFAKSAERSQREQHIVSEWVYAYSPSQTEVSDKQRLPLSQAAQLKNISDMNINECSALLTLHTDDSILQLRKNTLSGENLTAVLMLSENAGSPAGIPSIYLLCPSCIVKSITTSRKNSNMLLRFSRDW